MREGIIGNKTLECERSAIQNMMKQFYATLHKCPFRLQWFPLIYFFLCVVHLKASERCFFDAERRH